MSRLSEIQTSKTKKPVRVLIYGIEGVGKTTFGSEAPKPIFISPEGGTDEIKDAVEMPNIRTFDDVRSAVQELITGQHDFKTLVLDSADWIEKLAHSKIIGSSGKSITHVNGGYGAGYNESENLHKSLVDNLTELREKRGMNIVVIAHYHVRTVKDPEALQDYDAFEIKCQEKVSSIWREWVDCILFARFETFTKAEEGKEKALAIGTSNRIMYTEKRPAFQAKNRYGLPLQLPVSWKAFVEAKEGSAKPDGSLKSEVEQLTASLSDKATQAKVNASILKAGDDQAQLVAIRDRLLKITRGAA